LERPNIEGEERWRDKLASTKQKLECNFGHTLCYEYGGYQPSAKNLNLGKCRMRPKFSPYLYILGLTIFAVGCGQYRSAPYVPPPPSISVAISPQSAAVGTGLSTPFTAMVTGDTTGVMWTATAGTIDANGNFTAPSGSQSSMATVTATSKKDTTKSASATVNVVAPGVVAATANVQVALYTIAPPAAGNVSVQFGTDTNYGLTTWTQPAPQGGGPVSLFVAGMRANTPYHMRGVVQFSDGTQFMDADQTFTTGAIPAALLPTITTTTTAGMTPQSGVELLDMVVIASPGKLAESVVTDLAGNVLWAYGPTLPGGAGPNPIKLLPNGHFLIVFSGQPDGANFVMQEVDLGGTVIWQMTAADLNTALAAATCAGCKITVVGAHHDFQMLPNGHLILLASTTQVVSGTTVTGDVLIDLDENHKPVWLWNEFDHLDISRRPYLYPDWAHTNAVIYSADDGNLIISIRHQNWLVKIDYNNGAGAGDILWRLGFEGDFTLLNASGGADTDPTDWFYAQHGPAFVTPNTTGKFSLVLFDNGDDRGVSVTAGGTCGVAGQPACFSTVPILELDETAKTATLAFHPTTPDYSFFGGNAEVLKNGNVEYDECASTPLPSDNAAIFEATSTSPPQTVWQMHIAGQFAYRGFRMPSLYPGVQW
jgi:arylsulfate sulfotransferase